MEVKLTRGGSATISRKDTSNLPMTFEDMSTLICKKVRIGSEIGIVSDNTHVKRHSGKYSLLFMEEFDMVYLFYLDTAGILRVVQTGSSNKAVDILYGNIADKTRVGVLKSSSKRAYRVICRGSTDDNLTATIVSFKYKNKSSQICEQVYLNLFEAINFAAQKHLSTKLTYDVITPKGTVLFSSGGGQ